MVQTVIVAIIVAIAAAAAAVRLYRFIKRSGDACGCGPAACESCPHYSGNSCSEGKTPVKIK